MLAVVIIVAIGGVGYIVITHASTPNPLYPNYCSYKVIWSQAGVYNVPNGYVIKYKYYGNSVAAVPAPNNPNWDVVQVSGGGWAYMKAASLQGPIGYCTINTPNAVPASNTSSPSTLYANQTLYVNQSLYSSDSTHQLIMQPDGNLVLYNNSNGGHRWIWQSYTYGSGSNNYLVNQPDGNLVEYNASGWVWQSHTYGSGSSNRLVVQPDGNMVLYNLNSQPLWYTNTLGQ